MVAMVPYKRSKSVGGGGERGEGSGERGGGEEEGEEEERRERDILFTHCDNELRA